MYVCITALLLLHYYHCTTLTALHVTALLSLHYYYSNTITARLLLLLLLHCCMYSCKHMLIELGCHRGMVGPERGLRPQKDPLWLDMAAVRTRPANRPAIPADALDAIPMFKDKPTSDEEQEQCTRQLSAQVGARLSHMWPAANLY